MAGCRRGPRVLPVFWARLLVRQPGRPRPCQPHTPHARCTRPIGQWHAAPGLISTAVPWAAASSAQLMIWDFSGRAPGAAPRFVLMACVRALRGACDSPSHHAPNRLERKTGFARPCALTYTHHQAAGRADRRPVPARAPFAPSPKTSCPVPCKPNLRKQFKALLSRKVLMGGGHGGPVTPTLQRRCPRTHVAARSFAAGSVGRCMPHAARCS
jgi:hypothetical protein